MDNYVVPLLLCLQPPIVFIYWQYLNHQSIRAATDNVVKTTVVRDREVLNYYSHNWEKLGGVDYRHVLKMCHQINLRTDAVLHLYGSTFANVSAWLCIICIIGFFSLYHHYQLTSAQC